MIGRFMGRIHGNIGVYIVWANVLISGEVAVAFEKDRIEYVLGVYGFENAGLAYHTVTERHNRHTMTMLCPC